MAQNYKVLGQIFYSANAEGFAANTIANVYVTSAAANAIVSTIYITNQDIANANVDIIVRPSNEALSNKHYVLQNHLIEQADTLVLNLNLTMGEDTILAANNSIRAGEFKLANVSINAFGVELT